MSSTNFKRFLQLFAATALLTGCAASGATPGSDSTTAAAAADSASDTVAAGTSATAGGDVAGDPGGLRPAPEVVRALYVNRFAAQSRNRMRALIEIADRTEINAFVIDMKDEFGLNYRTENPEFARYAGDAGVIPRLQELLDTLKAHDILPIARLVVFKDSVTARVRPEWTIRKTDGSIWRDRPGLAWVNPYNRGLWDYNIGVAVELAKLGFGEIQFDYIRFPEPYASLPQQVFPGADGVSKPDALAEFLKIARERINRAGVRSTADVFGLVTTVRGPLEIGQWWEKVAPVTDVLLPMVYPSHYPRGAFGIPVPNAEPYKVVKIALDSARVRNEKLGITTPEHVRPWLQAFTLGQPAYTATEVKEQMRAVYDAGYDGWVLWHPGSRYEPFVPALEKTLVSRKKNVGER